MPHLREAPSPSPASDSSPDSSAPRSRLAAEEKLEGAGSAAQRRPGKPRNLAPPNRGGRLGPRNKLSSCLPKAQRTFQSAVRICRRFRAAFFCLRRVFFPLVSLFGLLFLFCLLSFVFCLFSFLFSLFALFPAFIACFSAKPKNARPFGFLPDSARPRARRFKPRGFLRCGQPRSAAAKRSPSPRPAL